MSWYKFLETLSCCIRGVTGLIVCGLIKVVVKLGRCYQCLSSAGEKSAEKTRGKMRKTCAKVLFLILSVSPNISHPFLSPSISVPPLSVSRSLSLSLSLSACLSIHFSLSPSAPLSSLFMSGIFTFLLFPYIIIPFVSLASRKVANFSQNFFLTLISLSFFLSLPLSLSLSLSLSVRACVCAHSKLRFFLPFSNHLHFYLLLSSGVKNADKFSYPYTNRLWERRMARNGSLVTYSPQQPINNRFQIETWTRRLIGQCVSIRAQNDASSYTVQFGCSFPCLILLAAKCCRSLP